MTIGKAFRMDKKSVFLGEKKNARIANATKAEIEAAIVSIKGLNLLLPMVVMETKIKLTGTEA